MIDILDGVVWELSKKRKACEEVLNQRFRRVNSDEQMQGFVAKAKKEGYSDVDLEGDACNTIEFIQAYLKENDFTVDMEKDEDFLVDEWCNEGHRTDSYCTKTTVAEAETVSTSSSTVAKKTATKSNDFLNSIY